MNRTISRLLLPGLAALLLGAATPAVAQNALTDVAQEVNRKLVKLYGAGGFKGLPSYGSGVLVSPDGHILTTNTLMLTTQDLRVHLADGRAFHAKLVAKEPDLDVALVKLEEKVENLPHFDFAAAAARPTAGPGDWVLAFSNAFQIATRDEPMSVQVGVIAAHADLRGRRGVFEAPFQGKVYFLDVVANNPGAAGGALTTRKGELLGLIGRELKNQLTDTWVNYAVPVQAATEIERDGQPVKVSMAAFVKEAMAGKYKQGERLLAKKKGGGYHGVVLVPNVVAVTPPYVDAVETGSPAEEAGLQQDDLIVYVDGELVQTIRDLRNLLETYGPNDQLRVDVQRGNQLATVTLKLRPFPKNQEAPE